MSRDERFFLACVGLGLIAGGHKLVDAELGGLGVPHAVGADSSPSPCVRSHERNVERR
jgi:hypothetical protein